MASGMYANVQTWNPYKGCRFQCSYCVPSFQRQAKRQLHNCLQCYHFQPHEHPERLDRVPSADTIFVAGNGDISFAKPSYIRRIIQTIRRYPNKTFYLQSKRPECFKAFVHELPSNVILLTTLETNRDAGYAKVSKAPVPSDRFLQFLQLNYPRKVITVEPIMDFDLFIFFGKIIQLKPEYVWIGYNSHPKHVDYPEPSEAKVKELIATLRNAGITVKGKDLRGIKL